ncbi:MAG: glycosyltransferase [Planctomycetes bacterium]|nr:glycosyltransferase [Planctomycetota bacterium]MCB9904180.1 glycosyltransferase [Planctomycetota bacterium]
MKILHVITTLDMGGAEKYLLSQVRGQTARGHEVRVAYLKGAGSLRNDFLEAGAAQVIHAPLGVGSYTRLWPALRAADVVHTHLLKADMSVAPLALLAGKRAHLVSGKHNDEQVLKRPLVSLVHRVLGRIPARTIVLSDHVGRFFARYGGVAPAKQRRIYYGLDRTPFESAAARRVELIGPRRADFGWRPGDVVFVCVARFAPQKAHDVLLRAFHAARARTDAPLRLLLVGDDPFGDGRTRAEALARELQLGSDVRFAGIRRDVAELMAVSDVFVMSSLWEGLGLVFLEAMATGLPQLGSRVSAVPEVVAEGETGLLVPPGEVEPLAAGMVELASDDALRDRMAAAGRGRVARLFAIDRMVDETLDVYRELTGEAGGTT